MFSFSLALTLILRGGSSELVGLVVTSLLRAYLMAAFEQSFENRGCGRGFLCDFDDHLTKSKFALCTS